MSLANPHDFYLDPNRCIGCQACVQACSECDTHKGISMIQLQYVDRPQAHVRHCLPQWRPGLHNPGRG